MTWLARVIWKWNTEIQTPIFLKEKASAFRQVSLHTLSDTPSPLKDTPNVKGDLFIFEVPVTPERDGIIERNRGDQ